MERKGDVPTGILFFQVGNLAKSDMYVIIKVKAVSAPSIMINRL